MRHRYEEKRDRGSIESKRSFPPGELVLEFGRRNNWPLATRNIMVEGTLDVKYYNLADSLYKDEYDKNLLDHQLSLFAVGERERGGTRNIRTKFFTLRDILSTDPFDANGDKILAVCLIDNDPPGRGLANYLRGAGLVIYKDIFLLNRKLPSSTRAPHEFEALVAKENSTWKHLDCVIEDLVDRDLLDLFAKEQPQFMKSKPVICDEAHHYSFAMHAKCPLFRYVQDNALLADLQKIVDVLKAMRFALGLDPNGTPCQSYPA